MVVCVYVRDPDTRQPAHDLSDFVRPEAADELTLGTLPTVQQHTPPLEAVDVDGGHIAILGGHCRSCAQEHHLQFFFSCLLAQRQHFQVLSNVLSDDLSSHLPHVL